MLILLGQNAPSVATFSNTVTPSPANR
jgi:hypothetical protein